jgi:UDP-N-acetylmuramoyl-L-alanyl-D-glutamate--2,6-diaminopimelate ligase
MKHSVNRLALGRLCETLHIVLRDVSVTGPDSVVTGLSGDSRTTVAGDLFIAAPGSRDDGLAHVAEALSRGATAVLASRRPDLPEGIGFVGASDVPLAKAVVADTFFGHPSGRLQVVGITGTNGKTTVASMLRSMLTMDGIGSGLVGTLGAWIGSGYQALANTTPDAIEVQRLMARMVDENLTAVVMEVSSHALMQHRVHGVDFDVGVFTNLSQDHLDYHGDMGAYGNAKARLFDGLGEQATAVLNADDALSPMLAERTAASVVRFGFDEGAQVRALIDRLDAEGSAFRLVSESATDAGARDIVLPLVTRFVGRHNISNALAAAAAALALGMSPAAIRTGLTSMPPVPGRLEPVECGQDFRVFVDYAHTPDALDKVLAQLRPLTKGRLSVVFGCGGDRDTGKRPLMGAAAARWADALYVTSDNPRSEEPGNIVDEIVAGIPAAAECSLESLVDRREAIGRACTAARGGDVVLVAGKGHETTQVVGDQVLEFDDCQVTRETLWSL